MKHTGIFFPKPAGFIFLTMIFAKDTSAILVHPSKTNEEKERIFRFRYQIYIEEFKKVHLKANDKEKTMLDDNDAYAANYYANDTKGNIIGTARAHRGTDGPFLEEDVELYSLNSFKTNFGTEQLAVVNRLAIARKYRHTDLATKFFIATYNGGLEIGTKLCFILSEERLLPMYRYYGFRVYDKPVEVGENKKKRYLMVLCLCDKAYLENCSSPLAQMLNNEMDDHGATATKLKAMGFNLC